MYVYLLMHIAPMSYVCLCPACCALVVIVVEPGDVC